MNKQILLAAIGAGILLTGCQGTKVMGERRAIPAPTDDAKAVAPVEQSADLKATPAPALQKPQYEPMTDVKPSVGVDSAAAAVSSKAASGTYVVKAGDFPAKIARKCHVSVSALMAANNLTEESARKLRVGQTLVIPTGKAAAVKSAKSVKPGKKAVKNAKKSAKVTPAPATEADGKYTVKPGDSPAKIAKRFHVKVSALMAANNLNETTAKSLRVGQKLVIPGKNESVAAAPAAPVAAPAAPVADAAAIPTAAAADSAVASDVASAPVTVTETQTNAITDSNNTSADDGIEAVEISADTTLAEYAAKNNIPLEKLRSINEGKDQLHKGDLLFVPKK